MYGKIYQSADVLKKALDGIWLRNKAISNNITNVNTPGYKRITVEFEDSLRQAIQKNSGKLKTTDKNHIQGMNFDNYYTPRIIQDKSFSYRFDGNNVDIDTETGDLAKNYIMYEALIKQISDEYEKIKNVINEGSK